MARPHPLKIHSEDIDLFFQVLPLKAFTFQKLSNILELKKLDWGLSYRQNAKYMVEYFIKTGSLIKTEFRGDNYLIKEIYSWQTKDEFTIVSGLKSDSYYMYYSALFLHGLTQQIPKTYYLNVEHHSNKSRNSNTQDLTQEAIDEAFASEQRKSAVSFTLGEKKIIITNSKNTDHLGVIHNNNEQQSFYYTDLERTLIDIVVRPAYSGGVFEILEAYKQAKGQLKVKRLASYLKKLRYTYPYHQSIGFFLEKAGYEEKDVMLFDTEKPFKFYLTYQMRNKEYSKRWKIYYPKGF